MLQGHRAIDEEEEELGRSHVEMVELDLKDEGGVASGNLSPGVKYVTINGARRVWQAVCYLVTSWIFWLCLLGLWVMSLFQSVPMVSADVPGVSWSYPPLNVTRAVYVTMEPEGAKAKDELKILRNLMGFPDSVVHPAVNGRKVDRSTLPLYTRYLMETGRHDHSQVSTPGMIGCYLSHVGVLEKMKPGDVYAVFEEDAGFSLASPVHMKNLDKFIKKTGLKFDALMIGINRMPEPKGGDVKRIEVASDLSLYMCSKECSVWGTRGYIISYEGAQKVLSNAKPIITQIDALFSLVASYEDFKFFWLSTDIAVAPHWLDLFLKSKVQDNCLKCYLPSGHLVYIGIIIFAVVSIVFVVVVCLATFGPLRGWAARLRGDKPPEDREEKVNLLGGGGGGGGSKADPKEAACEAVVSTPPKSMHRRTGSRDVDVSAISSLSLSGHRRSGSRDVDVSTLSISGHKRTGSRDSEGAGVGGLDQA